MWKTIGAVRKRAPLVHNITNYVVMNNTANALLAAGASPVMAHAVDEVADMVEIADALVINIGTLSAKWIEAMEVAMKKAGELQKPIIFDPVGAGATPFRTSTAIHLLSLASPAVIRANASEILALVSSAHKTKGVDSSLDTGNAYEAAKYLNGKLGSVICISGKADMIIAGENQGRVLNGDSLMARVTGMGCTATALIGACASVAEDPFFAAMSAMAFMGVAGEMAAESAAGPGSFQVAFLDQLHLMTETDFLQRVRVEVSKN